MKSFDPANGEVIGEVDEASTSAVSAAAATAREAQPAWAERPAKERAKVIGRFRQVVAERREEIAELIVREAGKPWIEANMADVLPTLEAARFMERRGPEALSPQKVRLANPLLFDRRSKVEALPVGLVGIISPWNYPMAIPAAGTLAALMAGNAVLLKPSELTPLVGQWMVDRLHEAGVPADVVQVLHGDGRVGSALLEQDLDAVVFTGSLATGRKVAEHAARRLIPAILELGGKDPAIVLPGAKEAVRGITWGAFTNAGQTCASVERVYVPDSSWAPRFASAAQALHVGPGMDHANEVGPLINDDAVKRVLKQVKDAEKAGAEVLTGGEVLDMGPRFVAPTVLAGVNEEMAVMREETFGPVLPVATYGHIDEAVHWANDSEYGLTASVWGPGAEDVADRLEAGTVTVNDCIYTFAAAETPWSGWRHSGHGVGHGAWGIQELTRLRHTNVSPDKGSAWHYPYDAGLRDLIEGGTDWFHRRRLKGAGRAARGLSARK